MRGQASLLILALSGFPAETSAQRCTVASEVTELGTRRPASQPVPPGSLVPFRPRAEDSASRYLRLQLELSDASARDWRLSIRDPALRLIEALDAESFGERNVWSRRLPLEGGSTDPRVLLDLVVEPGGGDPGAKVIGYLAMPRDAENPLYSRSTTSREFDLYASSEVFPDAWRRRGDSVALVLASWKKRSWCCSGVFVAPNLLITNWHCGGVPRSLDGMDPDLYWNPRVCESLLVDSSWDGDALSREYVPTSCDIGSEGVAKAVVAADRDLDYALVRVRQRPPSGPQQVAPVRTDADAGGGELVVLHHAECRPKLMSDRCRLDSVDHPSWIDRAPGTDFTHTCNTELGSSGAPVFDDQGALVGLHHLGFAFDATCQVENSDKRNKAVKIRRILRHLPRALCSEIVGPARAAACAAAVPP